MGHIVSPSILNADFGNLENQIELVNSSKADWLHLDIMDGVFVPNITFGFHIIKHMQRISKKPLDVHLMIVEPERYIDKFHDHGASILTIHYEACRHLHRTIEHIHSLGMKAGVALIPHSPVLLLEDIIQDVDIVLLMTVSPGFGGQKFIANSYAKIRKLKELILKKDSKALIEVDGGISLDNIGLLLDAGADVFVAGTSIFKSADPAEMIRLLKEYKK
jgi:ribulose-phosphate 3-epimerase